MTYRPTAAGPESPEGGVMQFFKPLSTLAVGIAVGYFLLPKVIK